MKILFIVLGLFTFFGVSAIGETQRAVISEASIETLLGKPLADADVQKFLNSLRATNPEIMSHPTIDGGHYRSYRPAGISLLVGSDSRLINLSIYAEVTDGFRQFPLSFPQGLVWNDDRVSVLRKLGLPACVGGGGRFKVALWEVWNTNWGSLTIRYRTVDGKVSGVTVTSSPCVQSTSVPGAQ
jgi:hypothetical protein